MTSRTRQQRGRTKGCKIICTPSITFSPALSVANFINAPRVRMLASGEVRQLPRTENLELFITAAAPTAIPRVSVYTQIFWVLTADGSSNPFTGYTASELDEETIRTNPVAIKLGGTLTLLKREELGGWLGFALNVADQFGPAAQPEDASTYTHKLDLELAGVVGIFNWLPQGNWLRNVTAYATMDYLATGLPNEGDEVPDGTQVYLDDASHWFLFSGLSFPVAPLTP